jgi:2-polyprenyl-3-methyl-5-hydroxy-6-metoxy-1,4-benzoquinol methylase
MEMDIIPVLFHGNGQAISKHDPFYLKDAVLASRILKRIDFKEMMSYGESYQERAKKISRMFRQEHATFASETDRDGNPYYRYKLIKNYIYKGPVLEWYLRVKIAMEKDYKHFESLISPNDTTITDIGCGYGFLAYMLTFRSDTRTITGIDYDKDKIEVANHNFSKNKQLNFISADASEIEFNHSDIFILSDVLHYLPKEKQNKILLQCIRKLNDNGKIIIRDGDSKKEKKHLRTRLSEIFSTKILNFNKTKNELYFFSTEEILNFTNENNMSLQIFDNDQYGSNTLYMMEKQQ